MAGLAKRDGGQEARAQRRPTVYDAGPTPNQYWVTVTS